MEIYINTIKATAEDINALNNRIILKKDFVKRIDLLDNNKINITTK